MNYPDLHHKPVNSIMAFSDHNTLYVRHLLSNHAYSNGQVSLSKRQNKENNDVQYIYPHNFCKPNSTNRGGIEELCRNWTADARCENQTGPGSKGGAPLGPRLQARAQQAHYQWRPGIGGRLT